MSGHSKWKNIQHRKGAQDARRGKVFTKIGKEISVAVKASGTDPEANPRLRAALMKARASNMPRDNIDRAIKRGIGGAGDIVYSEKTYEGYATGGVAVVVECLTDNPTRTVSDVRHALTRFGGNLGTDGSVSWMFKKKGLLIISRKNVPDYDALLEIAMEHDAEDVKEEAEVYEITCPVESFSSLKDAIDAKKIPTEVAELTRIPENYIEMSSRQSESLNKMVDLLEDNDDVQNVYHNASFPDQ